MAWGRSWLTVAMGDSGTKGLISCVINKIFSAFISSKNTNVVRVSQSYEKKAKWANHALFLKVFMTICYCFLAVWGDEGYRCYVRKEVGTVS